MSGAGLPEFENPPVVEVAVSTQFAAPVLSGATMMLRWSQIRDQFPTYQEVAPIHFGPAESFGEPREAALELQIGDVSPPLRLLMFDKTRSRVLQLQPDAIGYSWRNFGGEREYPRYAAIIAAIIEEFGREFSAFSEFLSNEGLERPKPVQCEVTYVNIISLDEIGREPPDLGVIAPSAEPPLSDDFLREDGTPTGRLFVSVEPQYVLDRESPHHAYSMRLTARAKPQGENMSDVIGAMNAGHEWMGFASQTSEEMRCPEIAQPGEFVAASDTMSVPSIAYEYMRPARGAVPLWRARGMKWFPPTLAAMFDLYSRSSAPDWEAEKIRYSAMHAMLNVLANTLDSQTPPPVIVPTWDGGLQAEWHRNGVDLEIEIGPDGKAEYYFFSESEEIESPVGDDLAQLTRCVKALR